MTAMLEARGLAKAFGTGSSEIRVLTDCSISVQRGERVAVLGHSGVGKSTMLHLLAGLDRPDAGSILFDGSDVSRLSETEQAQMRNRRVGMVFQFYHLLPEFSAHENVMMPMLIARAAEGASDRAHQLLEEVGLSGRAGHFPSELSGGERQRVAIARALARAPDVLLADEPTGNLDHDNGIRVMELFDQLYESHRMAIVMVTHNPDLTGSFDRVLTMAAGGFLSAYDRDGT